MHSNDIENPDSEEAKSTEDAVTIGRVFSSRDWDFVISITAIPIKASVQAVTEKTDRTLE